MPEHTITTSAWENLPAGFSPAEPLYVITDIHGYFDAMSRLLSCRPRDARLVFLGDAMDRGPNPMETLAALMSDKNNVLLHGNHDAMAWYAQPDVFPSYAWAWDDWTQNGGRVTREVFRNALKQGAKAGEIASGVPLLFENFWFAAGEWWQSGNIIFVHAGLPENGSRSWLDMGPLKAATRMSSPLWWRPSYEEDLYINPRKIDDKEVYVVSGHNPLPERYALRPYGITLDRAGTIKMAAELRPAEDGQPAKVRLITTTYER
ncbi:MAG: metallophosphoesterase [Synergistaceae bacterium]|nr:metallophosphoesterase [Synergistaceae bacterium]